jgi:hypothetical protein
VGVTIAPELSLEEFVAKAEESLATDIAFRDQLEQDLNHLRLQYDAGLTARYMDDPEAVGLPSANTSLGKMHTSIAAKERELDRRRAEVLRKEAVLQAKREELLLERTAVERRRVEKNYEAAAMAIDAVLVSLGNHWEALRLATEDLDQRVTASTDRPVYRDFERLIQDRLGGLRSAELRRFDGLTARSRNTDRVSELAGPGIVRSDGWITSRGWGES